MGRMAAISDEVFAKHLRAQGVPLGTFLGAAAWGSVYQHTSRPGRVIKVTQMKLEAEAAFWIFHKQRGFAEPAHTCLPIIFDFQAHKDAILGKNPNYWIIERESLDDFDLAVYCNIPISHVLTASMSEELFWRDISNVIFDAVESASDVMRNSPRADGGQVFRGYVNHGFTAVLTRMWNMTRTAQDAQIADRLGHAITTVRRLLQHQQKRLEDFVVFASKNGFVIADAPIANWGLRHGTDIVFRDLGGFNSKNHTGRFAGFGAFEPKLLKGGRWDADGYTDLIPSDFTDLQMFRIGFEAGLDARGGQVPMDLEHHSTAYVQWKPWRTGYAVGREVRGNAERIAFIYNAIRVQATAAPHTFERTVDERLSPRPKRHAVTGIEDVFHRFAVGITAAKSGSVSTDGTSVHSYGALIAQKRMQSSHDNVCYVEKYPRSKTSTGHVTKLRRVLEAEGWKILEVEFPQ